MRNGYEDFILNYSVSSRNQFPHPHRRHQDECLANLESLNAHFVHQGLPQAERLKILNQTAIQQMKRLLADRNVKQLEDK
ncbi:hypothetical protein [Chlorobium sp. N1]|uniref:hypothetical protein n=1 Tax=Chlorobium sp. N1 TaxID=2491138 RepID=UPI001A946C10|nr:hypothetical protein [Chlorobium sp. N1]